jgi:uncharacterized Zn finger protein
MDKRLETITSECPICSGQEVPTGRMEQREDNHLYIEFQCLECKSVGWEWSKDHQIKLSR